MGDMADWICDNLWPFDEYGDEEWEDIQCKYCKRWGFHWVETDKGWRLATEYGKLHKCKAFKYYCIKGEK